MCVKHNCKHWFRFGSNIYPYKVIQVNPSKYLYEWNTLNEQLMIMVQKMHKVKEWARPYLQRRLVNVTRPDKKGLSETRIKQLFTEYLSVHITLFYLISYFVFCLKLSQVKSFMLNVSWFTKCFSGNCNLWPS